MPDHLLERLIEGVVSGVTRWFLDRFTKPEDRSKPKPRKERKKRRRAEAETTSQA